MAMRLIGVISALCIAGVGALAVGVSVDSLQTLPLPAFYYLVRSYAEEDLGKLVALLTFPEFDFYVELRRANPELAEQVRWLFPAAEPPAPAAPPRTREGLPINALLRGESGALLPTTVWRLSNDLCMDRRAFAVNPARLAGKLWETGITFPAMLRLVHLNFLHMGRMAGLIGALINGHRMREGGGGVGEGEGGRGGGGEGQQQQRGERLPWSRAANEALARWGPLSRGPQSDVAWRSLNGDVAQSGLNGVGVQSGLNYAVVQSGLNGVGVRDDPNQAEVRDASNNVEMHNGSSGAEKTLPHNHPNRGETTLLPHLDKAETAASPRLSDAETALPPQDNVHTAPPPLSNSAEATLRSLKMELDWRCSSMSRPDAAELQFELVTIGLWMGVVCMDLIQWLFDAFAPEEVQSSTSFRLLTKARLIVPSFSMHLNAAWTRVRDSPRPQRHFPEDLRPLSVQWLNWKRARCRLSRVAVIAAEDVWLSVLKFKGLPTNMRVDDADGERVLFTDWIIRAAHSSKTARVIGGVAKFDCSRADETGIRMFFMGMVSAYARYGTPLPRLPAYILARLELRMGILDDPLEMCFAGDNWRPDFIQIIDRFLQRWGIPIPLYIDLSQQGV